MRPLPKPLSRVIESSQIRAPAAGAGIEAVAALVGQRVDDREQLVGGVVGEVDHLREPRPQAGVRADELLHLVGVARHHHHDPVAPVLDELDDGVDRLAAEVALAAAHERVRLVDEQHALVGLVEAGQHQRRGLPDVAGHQAGPVGLHEVAALDDAEGAVDLGEQAGDGGLPGAGVAR